MQKTYPREDPGNSVITGRKAPRTSLSARALTCRSEASRIPSVSGPFGLLCVLSGGHLRMMDGDAFSNRGSC